MISVLIPIYNYNVFDLVKEIHNQLTTCKYPFEIICFEDGSSQDFINQNSIVKKLSNTSIIISKSNNGRIKSRQILAEQATYDWLLFLDADVLPKQSDFILKYIDFINLEFESVFGGICYHKQKPEAQYILRWKYGINKEEIKAEIRKRNTYKHIVSANMFIKKTLFISINSKIEFNGYGMDNYFASLLREQKINIDHIDNEVYHLGIEKSEVYLEKKESAIINLLMLYNEHKIDNLENDLFSLFIILKRYQLHYLFSVFYKFFKSLMKQNLLGKHPSILLLQLYRITFMCNTSLKKNL